MNSNKPGKTQIADWGNHLDNITNSFVQEFGHIPVSVLRTPPSPGRWSVAQNIAHLILLNSSYFTVFSKVCSGAYRPPAVARIPFLPRLTGRGMVLAMESRERPIKTFKMWRPDPSAQLPDPLAAFREHQETFKWHVQNCAFILRRNPVVVSPALSFIAVPLDDCFNFLIAHEQRHLDQAKQAAKDVF